MSNKLKKLAAEAPTEDATPAMSAAQVACYVHHRVIEELDPWLKGMERAAKEASSKRDRADAGAVVCFGRQLQQSLRLTNNALLHADRRQVVEAGVLHHDARQPVKVH